MDSYLGLGLGAGKNNFQRNKALSKTRLESNKNKVNELNLDAKRESTVTLNLATSSHEGNTHHSKYHSDVYHTTNTDYMNNPIYYNNGNNKISNTGNAATVFSENKNNERVNTNNHNEHNEESFTNNNIKKNNLESTGNNSPYQIFDANYNVHLKFLINQDSKLHEIQFVYNLLRDNIADLMEEIQNEFNFSHENLNHIYETLKKISIYSKFYKTSDILHDNSF
jgi:hypothetical protein